MDKGLVFAVATAMMAFSTWQLWLLPTLLLRGVRLGLVPQVTGWDADPPDVETRAWIETMSQDLAAHGFKSGERTCVRGEIATSVVWRAHLRHKQSRTRAAVSAWFLDGEQGPVPIRQELTLQVEAAGGRTLLLTTGDDVDDGLWPPGIETVVLPGEDDVAVVLACFERRLAELGSDLSRARKNQRSGPDEAAAQRQALLDHQQEVGLVRQDTDAGVWRLTWTGACMNAFYQFWPLRRRTVRAQRRMAARLRAGA